MNYAYIRVSTEKQTVENQRYEIERFATEHSIVIERWIEEVVSGTKEVGHRLLGKYHSKMTKGDTILVADVSRLGRDFIDIMIFILKCIREQTTIMTVKGNMVFRRDMASFTMAFAFGMGAQIERDLISQRTKEGLARRSAQGMKLGRKVGGKNTHYKLTGKEDVIRKMLDERKSKAAICRKLKCNLATLNDHLIRMVPEEDIGSDGDC